MEHFKKTIFTSIIFSVILITGCSPFKENNQIEEIAPVIFWSIEEGEGEKFKMSTIMPPLIAEKKQIYTLEVDLIKESGKEFNLKNYRELKVGQLRMIVINEEVARKGIKTLINTLLADPDISQRLYLVVVSGSFNEYISNQLEQHEKIDYFFYRMLRHFENKGEITVVNLHQFMKNLYTPLSDPVLPFFKADNENLTYNGTAVFKEDKLVDTMTEMEEQIFQLINNHRYLKYFKVPAFSLLGGHIRSKVDVEFENNYKSVSVQVDLEGKIEDYLGEKDLTKQDELDALTQEMESHLEKQTKQLLNKYQDKKVDPFHMGKYTLKPFESPINDKEWINKWEQMEINVDYNLKLSPLNHVDS
ncbi:Ger(x)C family spore germination protein [Alteribacillus sp. JSM 102045]|uniref:Ger(x)C family spore germination protein n=1 Tax=Alteribacillus sp. JSM 102045 TaxID=1562101 RepID=UPI0035C13DD9